MAIGQRTELVVIQEKSRTADVGPGKTVTWAAIAALPTGTWARVRDLNAGERLQAQAIGSHVAYELEIRYCDGVAPTQRVVWTAEAKTLQIVGVRRRRRDGLMFLDCRETA